MQRQQQQGSRIDLADLKGQIVKRIGIERSRQYFYYLSRLLTQKLSKNEFDKLCVRIIGKENLSLHNNLIRSILKNACDGKVPPSCEAGASAANPAVNDGHKQSGYTGLAQSVPWSNGVSSPKKSRSGIRDRKFKNRPGLIGSNGILENAFRLTAARNDSNGVITENGESTPCDYQRPVQHLHGFAEPHKCEREASMHQPRESHGLQGSIDAEDASLKDGSSGFPLHAPLGIPFCRSSIGGSCKPTPLAGVSKISTCSKDGSLPDIESLQKCMEQIAAAQGLEGVTMESAKILSSGLDLYLKRLISSCVNVSGGRSGTVSTKPAPQKQQIQSKPLNGLLPSNHHYIQNNGGPAEAVHEYRSISCASVLDFKVAMELNPQQLGEDWPVLLDKIYMEQFTE